MIIRMQAEGHTKARDVGGHEDVGRDEEERTSSLEGQERTERQTKKAGWLQVQKTRRQF